MYKEQDEVWDEVTQTWTSLKVHSATASLFSQTWDAWDRSSSFNMITDLRARKKASIIGDAENEEIDRIPDGGDSEQSSDLDVEQPLSDDDIIPLDPADIEVIPSEIAVDDDIVQLSASEIEPLFSDEVDSVPSLEKERAKMLPIEAAIFGLSEKTSRRT